MWFFLYLDLTQKAKKSGNNWALFDSVWLKTLGRNLIFPFMSNYLKYRMPPPV